MEIKKINHKKESDPQKRLKKSCSKNLISLLQTIKKYYSKYCKKLSEAYLGLCRTDIAELFCENSKRLQGINYFCKKKFIIDVCHYY